MTQGQHSGQLASPMSGFLNLQDLKMKPGLYANIAAKKERLASEKMRGTKVERMRSPGDKGAPTAANFKQSAKTAKK